LRIQLLYSNKGKAKYIAERAIEVDRGGQTNMNPFYTINEDEDGPACPRISAVTTASGIEIAGAYQPPNSTDWRLYVTTNLATVAGMDFREDHLHLFGREQARHWVELVAHLYVKASERRAVPEFAKKPELRRPNQRPFTNGALG
jgi:hypothetical protein